ncbi:MAG: ATP-binding protein [Gammaproteobacteria bacterium]|nr:ATP-binding protein [Gammaproteobacteria bacterium]MDE0241257.1 ATP-binding protein [bacterium]MDE0416460.1 ATP-binding protein [bacterium]
MYVRFVERRIREALEDTRIVLVCGPRQSGKTTLAQQMARDAIPFFTLDDATTLRAASTDPVGFVRGIDRAVVDEVQRAPELILAIKAAVDADPRPGRFLLTGSADLMTLPRVADSLAGRMGIVRLLPLAQAELRGAAPDFLDMAFAGKPPTFRIPIVGDGLVEIVLAGGYPEALTRSGWRRRRDWHLDYIEAIVRRDVRDVARIEQPGSIPRLLRVLAEHSGKLVNYSGFGAPLGMNHVTVRKYVGILENLFLVHTLLPWYTNTLKRVTKSPKLHFLDAGLLAALRVLTPERPRHDRTPFGPVLETFVLGELLKLASWADDRYAFSHFRDKERNEVDIVIEDSAGRIIGVDVKASATVSEGDFAGLRRLRAATRDSFAMGLVLYDHEYAVPYGDRMAAAPLSALWS